MQFDETVSDFLAKKFLNMPLRTSSVISTGCPSVTDDDSSVFLCAVAYGFAGLSLRRKGGYTHHSGDLEMFLLLSKLYAACPWLQRDETRNSS